MQVSVDGLDEPDLLGQKVHAPDAAGDDGPRSLGDFVLDVACREHRLFATAVIVFVQTSPDSPLASSQLFLYFVIHSKPSVAWLWDCFRYPLNHQERRGF